jgi:gluconate 2-dehydrogenase
LLTVPNVVLTPHIASATLRTRRAMAQLAADNLVDFFAYGTVRTPVNTPRPVARSA